MKNNKYITWAIVSVVSLIVFFIALVPMLTIGFADQSTQIIYFIVLALLFIFTFTSLFLTAYYRNKVASDVVTRSKKVNKYVLITILIIILGIVSLSVLNL